MSKGFNKIWIQLGGGSMGKWISGKIISTIEFDGIYVEDGDSEIDAIFPNGWEGEMTSYNVEIDDEVED
jgi:hypothetical protein